MFVRHIYDCINYTLIFTLVTINTDSGTIHDYILHVYMSVVWRGKEKGF